MTTTIAPISAIDPVFQPPIRLADLPAKSALRVLLLPDLHLPSGPKQKQVLLANRTFLDRHDWAILLGDVTACYGTPAEYSEVRSFVRSLRRPYSAVNGNHEFFFTPMADGSGEYGKRWERGEADVQLAQLERFNRFFQIDSCFQACSHPLAGFCLLGLDHIAADDSGSLTPEHDAWFAESLATMRDQPLMIFSHFPLEDRRLDTIRYYAPGRRPYLVPGGAAREELMARKHPTFWFSGHVHFQPEHPLSQPYQTDLGAWQVHCPDARGFGRADDVSWSPAAHDELFARTLLVERDGVSIFTTDLRRNTEVQCHRFPL